MWKFSFYTVTRISYNFTNQCLCEPKTCECVENELTHSTFRQHGGRSKIVMTFLFSRMCVYFFFVLIVLHPVSLWFSCESSIGRSIMNFVSCLMRLFFGQQKNLSVHIHTTMDTDKGTGISVNTNTEEFAIRAYTFKYSIYVDTSIFKHYGSASRFHFGSTHMKCFSICNLNTIAHVFV